MNSPSIFHKKANSSSNRKKSIYRWRRIERERRNSLISFNVFSAYDKTYEVDARFVTHSPLPLIPSCWDEARGASGFVVPSLVSSHKCTLICHYPSVSDMSNANGTRIVKGKNDLCQAIFQRVISPFRQLPLPLRFANGTRKPSNPF